MSGFKELQKEVCETLPEKQEPKEICKDLEETIEDQIKVEDEDFAESDFIIELAKEQILEDMKTLQNVFYQYTKFQSLHFVMKFEKLYWQKNPFYYAKETFKIGQFLLNFKASVKYNYIKYKTGVKLSDLHMVRIKVKNNKIKSISVKSNCCEYKRLRQAKKLKRTSKNTITYLKKIQDNPQLMKSKMIVNNWLEFSKQISEDNIATKPLFPKNEDSCIDVELISKAKDKILSDDFKLTDVIQYVLSDNENKTLKERYQEDFVKDLKTQLKETSAGELYEKTKSFTDTDWIYDLDNIKDKLIKEKTENLTLTKDRMISLFEENLLPKKQSFLIQQIKDLLKNSDDIRDVNLYTLLTPETFQKLSLKALLNKIQYFDFESASKLMFKTIAMSTKPEELRKLWDRLGQDNRSKIDRLVLEEASRLFPQAVNFEIPWEREQKLESCDSVAERQELIKAKSIEIDYKKLKEIYLDNIVGQLSFDELVSNLDQLPGADYILSVILKKEDMNTEKLFSSFEFLPNMLKEQYTGDGSGFVLPKIPQVPDFSNIGFKVILKKLGDLLIEKLIDYVSSLIISLIVKMLETLEKKVQNEINDLIGREGDSLEEVSLKNTFKDIIKETFCEDKGKLEETEKDLLARTGIDSNLANSFVNIIGNNATTSDLVNLITGDNGENTALLDNLWSLLQDTPLSNVFEEPSDVGTIFESIQNYLTDEQLNNLRNLSNETDEVINDSICLTNQQKDALDNLRKNYGLENNDDDDLSSIVGVISNGPASGILEDLQNALRSPTDPDCYNPDDTLLEAINEDIASILNDSVDISYNGLEQAFKTDMIGKRNSFFDNILADSKGVRLSSGLFSHERRTAYDLLFPNAADNIRKHTEKEENAGFFEKFIMEMFSDEPPEGYQGDKPYPNHMFPSTISTHCLDQIETSVESNNFETTIAPAKRGKKPDYKLEFRNKTEDNDFDYGFNILYKNFLFQNQTYQRNLDIQVIKRDLLKTKQNFSTIQDSRIRTSIDYSDYMDLIDELDNGEVLNKPYPNYLFDKFINKKAENIDLDLDGIYDKVSNSIIESVSKGMLKDKTNDEEFPTGYVFGFLDDELTDDDLTYVNPAANPNDESTWFYDHEEEEKILGKSATENPRVVFLDPAKYGGKYSKPKLYVKEADSKGWINLFNKVVPQDNCDDREDYLFLSDIKEAVKKKQKSIKSDKRMNLDPDCIYEPAYDKLLTSSQKANLEGIIKSTIRVYVAEAILRCLPAFSHLEIDFEENYNSLYLDYVVHKMEENMTDLVNWPSKMRGIKYWFYFLDACVDMIFRLVSEKEIEPSQELYQLLEEANEVSRNYVKPNEFDRKLFFRVKSYTQSAGLVTDVEYFGSFKHTQAEKQKTIRILNSFFYYVYGEEYKEKVSSKTNNKLEWTFLIKNILSMKVIKKFTRDYDIQENRELAKRILKHLISSEITNYKDKILSSFSEKPYITNINKFLIGNSVFTLNKTTYGTKQDLDLSDVKGVNELVTQNCLDGLSITQEEYNEYKEKGIMFLQHYFVFNNKETNIVSTNGVKSTNEIKNILNSVQDKNKYISDLFGNARVSEDTIEGSIGIKFGVRICMIPPSGVVKQKAPSSKFSSTRAYRMSAANIIVDGAEKQYQESQTIIPICSYEQDIIDKKISDFDLSSSTLGEDVSCYLDKLVESKEFKFLFQKLLPTNKITSLLALYYYDGFIESVGLADSEREEGNLGSRGNWKEVILEETKEKVADMFKGVYFSRDNKMNVMDKDINRKQKERINLGITPKIRFNIGTNVKRNKLKRITYSYCEQDDEQITLLENFLGD